MKVLSIIGETFAFLRCLDLSGLCVLFPVVGKWDSVSEGVAMDVPTRVEYFPAIPL